MANYRAVSSGVWSALARWQDDSSGSYVASTVLPGAADIVYANNFTVTLDIDVVVSQLRTTSATNVNAGGLFDFGAGNSVTANVFSSSASCVRNNTANIKTITGNILASAGGTNQWGVLNSSTGTLIINGNVNGGGGSISMGAHNQSTGVMTINGVVTGGSGGNGWGAYNQSSGVLTINGVVTGGNGIIADGVFNQGTGSVIVNGTAIGGNNAVGAWNSSTGIMRITTAQGSNNNAAVNGVSAAGTTIISNVVWPLNGRIPIIGFVRFDNTSAKSAQVTLENNTTQLLTDNSTVNYPIQADVRNLVQYGPGNIYTGTLVPDITPQDIFTAIANSSDPIAVRLRNVATVQTTGDQIAAAL